MKGMISFKGEALRIENGIFLLLEVVKAVLFILFKVDVSLLNAFAPRQRLNSYLTRFDKL